MKKEKFITCLIATTIVGSLLLAALPKTVGAIDSTTNKTDSQTQRIQNLKARADTEITKRLTALNSITSKVSLLKKLSTAQKASFSSDIQSNISNLTDLKTKIDADDDPVTLQADVKSIVTDYRIFALYVPKVHLLAGADVVNEIVANLNTLAMKLQTRISTAQQSGKEVATLKDTLTDMQAKISDANTQSQSITSAVILLAPSGYPGNNSDLQNAQQMLKTAKTDIHTARTDAQQIINGLKDLQK